MDVMVMIMLTTDREIAQ